ncbi:hypothetical protein Clacol_008207 [Clathrus columnatus]|uniref:SprT-like domain-containing protein n=1 Tax=Clathrus columnatus TaxID=1419009 RepID=A0AAV5AHU3_9AGAM|nr:hypothetical protein Clacol_008207 [Clathrus columnatus]
MEHHEVIEISSDSDNEIIYIKQLHPTRTQSKLLQKWVLGLFIFEDLNAKYVYTGRKHGVEAICIADRLDSEHELAPPSTDSVLVNRNIKVPNGQNTFNYKRKTSNAISLPEVSVASPQRSPRKRKLSPQQTRLEAYAQRLFHELNHSVFGDQMPATELIWNVRLCTTAGRAFYHRDQERNVVTKVELSPKVLDCEERIKCTLAHEMCHLAVWVLDNDPSEKGHGSKFKKWAHLVEKTRPEITVKTTHSYEINFKYTWECIQCKKVYGRHSNSINVDKSACGVCTPPGTLKPLFEVRPRRKAVGQKNHSKFATSSPGESPRKLQVAIHSEVNDLPSDQGVKALLQHLTNLSI